MATESAGAALKQRLEAGMASLGLADTDQACIDRLLAYQASIARWNRVYNLTAVRDPADMLTQHLLDSLAVVGPLRRHKALVSGTAAGETRLLDVGSGAGLPGVVIALLQPDWQVCCVDAVAKKASFIRQVAGELGLRRLRAEHSRIEDLAAPPFQVITSRAFASLDDFTRLTRQHLAEGGVWMAMKGRVPEEEIAALPADVEVLNVEPLVVPGLEAQRCLVWMKLRGP